MVLAPSVPTIPDAAPQRRDRPAGRRHAIVYDRLRRPSRPGVWVRAGSPDGLPGLRQRRAARSTRILRSALILTLLVGGITLTLHLYSAHQLAPFETHRADYTAAAKLLRQGRVLNEPRVWTADVAGGTYGDLQVALKALGVRAVGRDVAYDAVLFRPGGVSDEVAIAHVPGRAAEIGRPLGRLPVFTAGGSPVPDWEPLGDDWYRIRGRW